MTGGGRRNRRGAIGGRSSGYPVRGGIEGVTATLAMSTVMLCAERLGVMTGQPPRLIIDRFAPGLNNGAATAAAVVFHGMYGAATGALFAALTPAERVSARWGAAYGLLVWVAGYEGWVPVAGVLPPAHRDERGRVITMITAHLVYGCVLGRRLEQR